MNNNKETNSGLSTQDSGLSIFFYWLPPIAWMTAIFFFSTDSFSGQNTGSILWPIFHAIFPNLTEEQFVPIHSVIRKAAHFTEYGILGLLLYRAFRSGTNPKWKLSWAVYSFLILSIYAFSDEYHQTFTRSRGGSVYDSLTDIAGGFTALLLVWVLRGRKKV